MRVMDNQIINNIIKCRSLLLTDVFTYTIPKEDILPTEEFSKFCDMMRQQGFTNQQIMEAIDDLEYRLNSEVADHIRSLMEKHNITVYRINELCGLSDRYINCVLEGKRSISKEYVFGLCLFFELSQDEVGEFLKIRGISLDNSIQDKIFKMFVENGKYGLMSYTSACRKLAKAANVPLPDFFNIKPFTDKTISDKK